MKIGQDFLEAFDDIMGLYCVTISNSSRKYLSKLLFDRVEDARMREVGYLEWLAASRGRNDRFESAFRTVQDTYAQSHSTFSDRLVEKVLEHNIKMSLKKIDKINIKVKERHPLPEKTTPKYEIVKVGVDRMLKRLQLERPSTTKDEAKRVYANQTNDTYSNVNRLYYYTVKKK